MRGEPDVRDLRLDDACASCGHSRLYHESRRCCRGDRAVLGADALPERCGCRGFQRATSEGT